MLAVLSASLDNVEVMHAAIDEVGPGARPMVTPVSQEESVMKLFKFR